MGRLAALSLYVALSISCSGRAEEAKEKPTSDTRAVNEGSDGKAAPRPQESAVLDKRTILGLLAERSGRYPSWKARINKCVGIPKPGAPRAALEDWEVREELEAPGRLLALMKLKNAGIFNVYEIRDRPREALHCFESNEYQEDRIHFRPWIAVQVAAAVLDQVTRISGDSSDTVVEVTFRWEPSYDYEHLTRVIRTEDVPIDSVLAYPDRGPRHWPSTQEIRAERTPWTFHVSLQGGRWCYKEPEPVPGAPVE